MANARIKGITIELDGDTKGLDKALQGVNKESGKLQGELKQVERALKFDPSNVELLRQKQELLTESITQTSQKLDVLRTAQSQVQAQFDRGEIGADQYRAFQRELIATEGQLQSLQRRLNETGDVADEAGTDFNELGESIQQTGDKMKNVGSSMTTGVSAPIAGIGVAAGLSAKQFDDASAQIQTSLGLTADEAEGLEETAKSVWKNGFGESLEEVTDALVRVKQNVKGIADDAELERVTESALALAKTFDSDVNEVTRAGNNLMQNFGIDSEKAFDMMAKGAQNGLNFSNEMFDNLSEYAPLWADMGFSAEEMFGILEAGAENGVYNMDYLNDVMKEFGIRILDGSKSTDEAMAGMLASTQELFGEFQEGKVTSADMAKAIAADLSTLENDVDRNAMGVALFGTKWEDLGGDVVLAMLTAGKGLEGFEGAMQGITDVQEQTFGQRWESMTRNAASSLEPLGMILLDLAEQWLPKIIAVIETLATWFADLSPLIQILVVAFGAIIAAIGPLLVVIGSIVSTIGTLIPLFASGGAAATAFGAVMAVLTGPVGIVIAIITALIAVGVLLYKNWEEVSAFLSSAWEGIKEVASTVFEAIGTAISTVWESIKSTTETVWNSITDFFTSTWEGITSIFNSVLEVILSVVDKYWASMKDGITSIWDGIKMYFEGAWEVIKNVFVGALLIILDLLRGNWGDAKSHTEQIWQNIKDGLSKMWEGIKTVFSGALSTIFGFIKTYWNDIKTTTSTVFEETKSLISTTWNNIKTFFSTTISDIKTSISNGFTDMKNAVFDKMTEAKNSITGIWNEVMSFFQNISLYDIGRNILQGLIDGVTSMAKNVIDSVTGVIDDAIEGAKNLLGIHSPSKVFMEMGEYTNEGFEIGIEKSSKRLLAAMDNVYGSLANSANKSMGNNENSTSSTSHVDYSKNYNPTFQIYTVESPEKVIKREMRKMVLGI